MVSGSWVRLIPLGGLGEIGMNMTCLETAEDCVVLGAGLMFPRLPSLARERLREHGSTHLDFLRICQSIPDGVAVGARTHLIVQRIRGVLRRFSRSSVDRRPMILLAVLNAGRLTPGAGRPALEPGAERRASSL